MGGDGLIGHLLSRPNPVLSPFAPVIRRTIPPSDGNRAILSSSSSSHFLFLAPHETREYLERHNRCKAHSFRVPSSFRNDDGPVVVRLIRALSYRIFDRANRFYSYRGCRRKWFKWEERWMDLLSLYNWKTFRTNAIGSRESSFSFVYPFASFLSLSVLFFFPRISSSFRTDRNEGLQTRNTIGR